MKSLMALCVIFFFLKTSAHAKWVTSHSGPIPQNAIIAGQDIRGQPLYICRAQLNGALFPGTLNSDSDICEIFFEGQIYYSQVYDMLIGQKYNWVLVFDGEIPFDAVPIRRFIEDNLLYICRGDVKSNWYPGRISRKDNSCIVVYNGKETKAEWYEVLVGN